MSAFVQKSILSSDICSISVMHEKANYETENWKYSESFHTTSNLRDINPRKTKNEFPFFFFKSLIQIYFRLYEENNTAQLMM